VSKGPKKPKETAESSVSTRSRSHHRPLRSCNINQDNQDKQDFQKITNDNENQGSSETNKESDGLQNEVCVPSFAGWDSVANRSESTRSSRSYDGANAYDTQGLFGSYNIEFNTAPISGTSTDNYRESDEASDDAPSSGSNLLEFVAGALRYHPNPRPGQSKYRSPLFDFVRLIMAHPEMQELDASTAAVRVEDVLRHLPDFDSRVDVWDQFFSDRGFEDYRSEFINCWEKIRTPFGFDAIKEAIRKAKEKPLVPQWDRGDRFALFVSIAGWLQVRQGGCPIELPVERLAKELSVTPNMVSTYRRWAIADGLLTKIKDYVRPSNGSRGRATEFRFSIEMFPELNGGDKS